jgi:uncharacterized protein YdeI (YjbR/CyaY-like superfamily)
VRHRIRDHFAEFGTKGWRAVEVVRATDEQRVNASEQAKITEDIEERLGKTNAALESAFEALTGQEKRLEQLEEKRLS